MLITENNITCYSINVKCFIFSYKFSKIVKKILNSKMEYDLKNKHLRRRQGFVSSCTLYNA